MARKLAGISIFWENNKPHGFGLTVNNDDGNLQAHFDQIIASYEQNMKPDHLASFLEQIRDAAKHKRSLTPDYVLLLIANMFMLEKHGLITSDEFNGLLFHWEEGD